MINTVTYTNNRASMVATRRTKPKGCRTFCPIMSMGGLFVISQIALWSFGIFLYTTTPINSEGGKVSWSLLIHDKNIRFELSEQTELLDVVQQQSKCSHSSIESLTADQLFPKADKRHMVDPPLGGKVSLVCCSTSAGQLSVLVHHKWAPLGADRFLDMVTSGYMSQDVPLMRCIQNFLCQFGIHSKPEFNSRSNPKFAHFHTSIQDDPNWLPEGKQFRENALFVKRFAKGYMAFAGAGPNSRGKQLIVALAANAGLGGGSPWEVPWGEVIGEESFATLDQISTVYGDKGPTQGKLHRLGFSAEMKEEFPHLSMVEECTLVDQAVLKEA